MPHTQTRMLIYKLFFVTVLLLLSAATIYPQRASAISGRWTWKEAARKNKRQTQFTLVIEHKGDVVRGVYSVDYFVNGTWQGEDGNQTPFVGRVKGAMIELEFDPSATVPGYEQNVTYTRPKNGRKPGTATLSLAGPTLQFRLMRATKIEGVPGKLTLKREPKQNQTR